jgi:hypothetical protein
LTTFGLTTDNRYLVLGYTALRVWDLHSLPPAYEDRLPTYRHGGPAAVVRCLRVISERVVETITIDGASRWNVETGQRVG